MRSLLQYYIHISTIKDTAARVRYTL